MSETHKNVINHSIHAIANASITMQLSRTKENNTLLLSGHS